MRKMGIDYGKIRIGISLSDILGILATAYENYNRVNEDLDLKHIIDIAINNNVDTFVLGLPTHLDGTYCDITEEVKCFGSKLQQLSNIKVVYQSELLTSVEAEDILKNAKYSIKDRKKMLDKVASTLILQDYLDEN